MDQKKHLPLPERQRELGQTIGEISRTWRYEMNTRLKPYGLNQSMQQVLVQLHRHPDGLMQRDLARKLGIEGPTLVRLLDLLEQKELIARIPSPDDKRRKYSVLTTKAAEQIRIIEKISDQLRSIMLEGLSSADVDSGLQLVRRMRNNLLPD